MTDRLVPVDDLTREQASTELEKLAQEIARHDILYFQKDTPEISDAAYDVLVQRNRQIESRFPDLRRLDSPTNRIGATPAQGFKKVKHRYPMLSLENAFSFEDVQDFLGRIRRFLQLDASEEVAMIAEPKIDGLSASLHYHKGVFTLGATRGDGSEGEDITENLKTISDIPLTLSGNNIPESLEIRGEIYMTRPDFFSLNKRREADGEQAFANPRNAAAGSVRQLDPSITANRPLRFFAYAFYALSGAQCSTQLELLTQLKSWGFIINPKIKLCSDIKNLQEYYNYIEQNRADLSYDIDGVVYKINNMKWQNRLGSIGRTPRHSIAHKFAAEQAETIVESIVIQVGRTGVLTPVAHLAPVTVGGVVVSRATLHNADEIARKDVRIGDRVMIQRAGDVIPQIVNVLFEKRPPQSEPFVFPGTCPACNSVIDVIKGEVARKCENGLFCPAQAIERLKHFVSRDAFDIEGLGGKHIEMFYVNNLIRNPVDIFTLEERDQGSLTPLRCREGWGAQSVTNLFQSIQQRRQISLDRFIYALGIPQIGLVTAKLLAKQYRSFAYMQQQLIQAQEDSSEAYHDLISIDGIGPTMANDLIHFFAKPDNQEVLKRLNDIIDLQDFEPTQSITSEITGKIIVFTGTLESLSRAEAKAQAERLGAKVTSSITKKTDLLVAGIDAGSKTKAAKELGIKIINENEWKELIEKRG